jgi:hypothetical protein
VEILLAYLQVRRALRRDPIERAVARLRRSGQFLDGRRTGNALGEARRLGRAVSKALTVVPGDTRCLTRSLVLMRLLARRGISARLVIGARAAPGFLAHAWVVYDGHAVLATGDGLFDRLVEL